MKNISRIKNAEQVSVNHFLITKLMQKPVQAADFVPRNALSRLSPEKRRNHTLLIMINALNAGSVMNHVNFKQ